MKGYDIGVMGGAVTMIAVEFELSDVQKEIIVSSLNLVAIFGAIIAGFVSDKYGRTKTLCAASSFFIVGMGIMTFSVGFWSLFLGEPILCL